MSKPLIVVGVVIIVTILIFSYVALSVFEIEPEPEVVLNQSPMATIISPEDGDEFSVSDLVKFDGSLSTDPDNDELTYEWNSDLSGKLGSESDLSTELEEGKHRITLTVTDYRGSTDTYIIFIQVFAPPIAVIDLPSDNEICYSSERICFDGRNSSSKYSPALSYSWSSDLDGVFGSTGRVTTLLNTGVHTITLTVGDGLDTSTTWINVDIRPNWDPLPVIDSPEYDEVVQIGTKILFDCSSSSDPDFHDLMYKWTSNIDGELSTAHKFSKTLSPGTHIISLEATDGFGGCSHASTIITVNRAPEAEAGADKEVTLGDYVSFDGSGSSDPDGDDLIYRWDFGDGNSDVGETVEHKFQKEGIFNVTLKIEDGNGGEASDYLEVIVKYVFRGTGVYGYVYENTTKKPLIDVEVWISGDDYNATHTNDTGYYEMHMEPGEYSVRCRLDHYYYFREYITLYQNQALVVNIYLIPYPPDTAKIYGYVYDHETNEPIYDAYINLWEKEGYYNYTESDSYGFYEINVPAMDLEIYCNKWSSSEQYEDYYYDLSLSENDNLRHDIYLLKIRPNDVNETIEFSGWDFFKHTQNVTQYSYLYWQRYYMDYDEDGYVTSSEVQGYEDNMERWLNNDYSGFTTEEMIEVDGVAFRYIDGSAVVEIQGAEGSINSTEPIYWSYIMNYRAIGTIYLTSTHDIQLNTYFDDEYENYEYYIIMPSFHVISNYSASENVNITEVRENIIWIDPLDRDEYGPDSEWVMITAKREV